MKKVIISLFVFISVILNVSESSASPRFKVQKLKVVFGCGEWKPIVSGSTQVGEYRECTNIFGTKRLEIVHFH